MCKVRHFWRAVLNESLHNDGSAMLGDRRPGFPECRNYLKPIETMVLPRLGAAVKVCAILHGRVASGRLVYIDFKMTNAALVSSNQSLFFMAGSANVSYRWKNTMKFLHGEGGSMSMCKQLTLR